MGRIVAVARLGAGVALGCVAAACAEEASAPVPADDTGGVETVDIGAGLVAEVPAGTPVVPLTDTTGAAAGDGSDCRYYQGAVGEGDDRVELSLNAAACAGEPEDRVGNGFAPVPQRRGPGPHPHDPRLHHPRQVRSLV